MLKWVPNEHVELIEPGPVYLHIHDGDSETLKEEIRREATDYDESTCEDSECEITEPPTKRSKF